MVEISPGPSSALIGIPVDFTSSPGPSPLVSSYTCIDALSRASLLFLSYKMLLETRTTSNIFASLIPSAITRGPDTFTTVPVFIFIFNLTLESLNRISTPIGVYWIL